MPRVPVIGRLTFREYVAIFAGSLFIALETILTAIIGFLPKPVIQWFYNRSRSIFHAFVGPPDPKSHKQHFAERIRRAPDFERLCEIFGYTFEEHVVLTKDGYLLGLHRLPFRKGEQRVGRGSSTGKPVVYLHHGLLMNSEVWVCLTDPERSYAFRLVELGYDVWLGNSRGNKYSKKSVHYNPNSTRFWDYSIDEFAWHAPAMSPAGLAAPIVDGLMKASPTLLYLIFGRKAILTSVPAWQSLLYPPVFDAIITTSLRFLFSWRSERLSPLQKLAAYPHLYSYCSVKSIVHWFQIMRNAKFQMYDDDVQVVARVATRKHRPSGVTSYAPARFPTRNIVTPIVLIYGDADSLVDIDAMMRELPGHTTARKLRGYEHLDILWGEEIDRDVIPFVEEALKNNCVRPERVGKDSKISMNGYLDVATDTDGTSTYGDGDR